MFSASSLLSLLTEQRAGCDTIVLSFGRFNPPHRGHKLLTDLLVATAQRRHGDAALWVKGRVGPKDPLSVPDKARFLKMLTPGLVVRQDPALPDPADVIQSYADMGYRHLVLVLGGDRTDKLTQDVRAEMAAGRLSFDTFDVLSAGDRSGSEMWSATEQRAAAAANDFDAFAAGLPAHFPAAREMFDKVRKGLGL
jgi:hypothetical protein